MVLGNVQKFDENLEKYIQFKEEHKKNPSKKSSDVEERRLGEFYNSMFKMRKNGKLNETKNKEKKEKLTIKIRMKNR